MWALSQILSDNQCLVYTWSDNGNDNLDYHFLHISIILIIHQVQHGKVLPWNIWDKDLGLS